jgi:hypothetical protein
MRFNLEHDWQGNMSTPPTRVGERAKIRLLILLCAVWLLTGLIGHEPWKPLESNAISSIKNILDNGSYSHQALPVITNYLIPHCIT